MSIDVNCPRCSAAYRVNDELSGRQFPCKRCGKTVPVPTDSTPQAQSRPSDTTSKRSKPASEATPSPRSRPPQDPRPDGIADPFAEAAREDEQSPWAGEESLFDQLDVEPDTDFEIDDTEEAEVAEEAEEFGSVDEQNEFGDVDSSLIIEQGEEDLYEHSSPALPPRRRKKKKKKPTPHLDDDDTPAPATPAALTVNLNLVNLMMLAVGCVITFLGAREMRPALRAGSTPTEISLDDLMNDGPGDQVYFTVTDVVAGLEGYVAEEDRSGNISQVWIPCSADDPNGDSTFVLYSDDVRTEADAEALSVAGTHTGMIVNSIQGLDAETRQLLQTAGIQPENALLFEVGRQPPGILKYGSLLLGGVAIIMLAVGWILFVHD